jgi:hypothetical protein
MSPARPGDVQDDLAEPPPIELTHARRRRPSRPHEPMQASQPAPQPTPDPMLARRRRQTGTMSLGAPAGESGPPVDLEPVAREPATPSSPPAAPPPLDGSARSRERSREREALERVLALAKPRTRQNRVTPAVLPPSVPPAPDDSDDSEGGDNGDSGSSG